MLVKNASLAWVVATPAQFPRDDLSQVAFAGRSNVGKSSLINALLGRRKLAYTSGTPGKTRQIFFYLINDAFYFVDLPGYGYARISKRERAHFKVLTDAYFETQGTIRGIILLLDPRRPVGEEEISFVHFLNSRAIPVMVVFTKWDRLRSSKRSGILKARKGELAGVGGQCLTCSARNGVGLDGVWRTLTGWGLGADH